MLYTMFHIVFFVIHAKLCYIELVAVYNTENNINIFYYTLWTITPIYIYRKLKIIVNIIIIIITYYIIIIIDYYKYL